MLDVMRRLLQPKNIMMSARAQEHQAARYISILNVIQVGGCLHICCLKRA